MKGIVMSVGLFVLSMGVSCGLMYYVSFEILRQETVFSLKQALSETMVQLDELDPSLRSSQAMNLFLLNFSVRRKSTVTYHIELMGMLEDPLALRIRIKAIDDKSLFNLQISAEETMIEVEE